MRTRALLFLPALPYAGRALSVNLPDTRENPYVHRLPSGPPRGRSAFLCNQDILGGTHLSRWPNGPSSWAVWPSRARRQPAARLDLLRDGRYVLHMLPGKNEEEFLVRGRARLVTDPAPWLSRRRGRRARAEREARGVALLSTTSNRQRPPLGERRPAGHAPGPAAVAGIFIQPLPRLRD